jgi:dihydrofolate synthase / folylpolyglutamate synthase
MKNTRIQKQGSPTEPRVRTYSEIVEYLDAAWKVALSGNRGPVLKQLDAALSNVSQSISSIVITGTNGKSLTAHFTARLLLEEGFRVGVLYAPHILTYNERFSLNGEYISNKQFTDIANEIISVAETQRVQFHASELLFMMAFEFFKQHSVDVVIVETHEIGLQDPSVLCHPRVVAVTRIIGSGHSSVVPEEVISDVMTVVKQGSMVISADQNKQSLQKMQQLSKEKGAEWAMPIRKVPSLPYPFEQLHGRCAALAERIASIFINARVENNPSDQVDSDSLLVKKKGQRGRPTLEAKRNHELNPPRTVTEFWAKTVSELPVRFQLLDKEKPSILLDNASNLDALENVLLGIRLLHYQKPFKGLSIILGCNDSSINIEELLKMLRYFFKKTSGQIVLCPVNNVAGQKTGSSLVVEKIANDLKSMKIKASSAENFEEAFAAAKELVDERNGLIVITGSNAIISEYWKFKGMKRI